MKSRSLASGLDILVAEEFRRLKGAKVGVLANQSAVDRNFCHVVDLLHESKVCELKAIFAPEHGFRGELQDMAQVDHAVDQKTGVPIHSLYGHTEESLTPSQAQLKNIDVLVADLPDIGSRYYTFAQSVGYAMKACQMAGVRVLVLDRPNPISGEQIEGNRLLQSCRSFCGYAPVPNRHGLTLGELAILMNKGFGEGADVIPAFQCQLEVLGISGWRRSQYFDETGLPWVIPSPNMPTLDTAIVYPGACLLEATNISEGRGTTRPFEFFGAPFLNVERVIAQISDCGLELNGARLRPMVFQPKFQKWKDTTCNGIQIHVTDRETFQPFRWFLGIIWAIKQIHPTDFAWRSDAYEFVDKVPAIDLLYGSSEYRNVLDSNSNLKQLGQEIQFFEEDFKERRKSVLLY